MKYNFGDTRNIESFLNEVGVEVELIENKDGSITSIDIHGDKREYKNLNDLNNFANEYLESLKENNIPQEIISELIEDYTSIH